MIFFQKNKLGFPEQEIRFTRAAEAVYWWVGGAVNIAASAVMAACSWYRDVFSALPHMGYALIPLILSGFCFWMAWRMVRYAYLIFTPIGIDILPLWQADKRMRSMAWAAIDFAELEAADSWLVLHENADRTQGVRLSLKPIARRQRKLLKKVIDHRFSSAKE